MICLFKITTGTGRLYTSRKDFFLLAIAWARMYRLFVQHRKLIDFPFGFQLQFNTNADVVNNCYQNLVQASKSNREVIALLII